MEPRRASAEACSSFAQIPALQLLRPDPLALRDVRASTLDLSPRLGVGQQLERVLEGLQILGTDQHSRRTAVPGERHTLVLALDFVHDLGEPGLDLGKWQRFTHDHDYSHARLQKARGPSTGPRRFPTLLRADVANEVP